MKISVVPLQDAWLIDIEPKADERGFFARTWCRSEFAGLGLDADIVQESLSYNRRARTLRRLRFQRAPHEETKVVRRARGAAFDVIVDLRPRSPTYRRWYACGLTAENRRALYIPKGFAYGFQTLTDDAEVLYSISAPSRSRRRRRAIVMTIRPLASGGRSRLRSSANAT